MSVLLNTVFPRDKYYWMNILKREGPSVTIKSMFMQRHIDKQAEDLHICSQAEKPTSMSSREAMRRLYLERYLVSRINNKLY